jgi:hypothetical protein
VIYRETSRKYLMYLLAANIGEIGLMTGRCCWAAAAALGGAESST